MNHLPVRQIIACVFYNETSSQIIKNFKYKDSKHLTRLIVQLMQANCLSRINFEQIDFICPVPLHVKRLKERTFNQSLVIAKAVSHLTKTQNKLVPDLLIRIKNTPPQVSLNSNKRLTNLHNAFIINPKYAGQMQGKKILLIDDVVTTCATIFSCASQINQYTTEVLVLTFARATF
jgi:ComF family protein